MLAQSCLYFVDFHLFLLFCTTIMKFWKWILKITFCFLLYLFWWDSKKKYMESYIKEKVRNSFPKSIKFHFWSCFWASKCDAILSTISLYDLCVKMWPQVEFCSGNISITLNSITFPHMQSLKYLFFNSRMYCLTMLGSTLVILASSRLINFSIAYKKNIFKIFVSCSKVLNWWFTWGCNSAITLTQWTLNTDNFTMKQSFVHP